MTDNQRMVYFAKAGDMIKVGCSINPQSRLPQLNEWVPFRMELVAVIEGGFDLEKRLHAYFSDEWSHGEWFHFSAKVQRVLEDISEGKGLSIPETPDCRNSLVVARIKGKATRRVSLAERKINGWFWYNGRSDNVTRPDYVQKALNSFSGKGVLPSAEALEAIERYERELAKLADAVGERE